MSSAAAVDNLDGTRTELFDVECGEATLLALLREVFEEHWADVIFGPRDRRARAARDKNGGLG